jgi:hypothetical protein
VPHLRVLCRLLRAPDNIGRAAADAAKAAADSAHVGALMIRLLLLLLDDPAAAVTGAPRFRRCVGLPSSSLLLELPSSEEEDRLSIVFLAALAYCSLVFFIMMSWEHWGPWTRKDLTRRKENPLQLIR